MRRMYKAASVEFSRSSASYAVESETAMSVTPATVVGYEIPSDHLEMRATIGRIARERIAPRAGEIDRTGEYPVDVRQLLTDNEIFALPFPERYGGTGTGTLMLHMAIEQIAMAGASCALMLML